jgi:ribosomal protein S27AE
MDEPLLCPFCESDVETTDEFCPRCGTLLAEGVMCAAHARREASGVCVVCATPVWGAGGRGVVRLLGFFLCNEHRKCEIYQGMVRVFGTSDPGQAEYAHGCLSQEGLHPFLYSRKASPISLGGAEYSLFRASGEYGGHIINEIKVMVPCQEFETAAKILAEIGMTREG